LLASVLGVLNIQSRLTEGTHLGGSNRHRLRSGLQCRLFCN
jgi:hypothetical protein